MSKNQTTIVWLRNDLRIRDNPALYHAAQDSDAVVPVFVWSPSEEGDWPPGGAHRWWLHESLQALDRDLRERGLRLKLREGASLQALRDLIDETNADAVYWNKRYAPAFRERDLHVAGALRKDNTRFESFPGRILHDPDEVQTNKGGSYHVYTPFWKKFRDVVDVPPPLDAPRLGNTKAPSSWPESADLDDLDLTPEAQDGTDWAGGLRETWTARGPGRAPGERGAHQRLELFVEGILTNYDDDRDRPDRDGTSMMSPRLHHGELSPRQIWHTVQDRVQSGSAREAADVYLSEIAWREFSYHLLYHHPETLEEPLRDKFEDMNWRHAPKKLRRWQKGETGYPIVDAAMRQLWEIGWMHNRLRMVVASFLTKDLHVGWEEGAAWFWDTLVGGDLANNTMGWQWAAGCGADAQPFFRIFNPVSQGRDYDPDGDFVRRWIPELADLPTTYLHAPWEANDEVLAEAGVALGEDYPEPIVDHKEERRVALDDYDAIK